MGNCGVSGDEAPSLITPEPWKYLRSSLEISQTGLLCLAAQMTAAADLQLAPRSRPPGERNRWTMLLYLGVEQRGMEIDIRYIERLERSINLELIHYGLNPVSLAQILKTYYQGDIDG